MGWSRRGEEAGQPALLAMAGSLHLCGPWARTHIKGGGVRGASTCGQDVHLSYCNLPRPALPRPDQPLLHGPADLTW